MVERAVENGLPKPVEYGSNAAAQGGRLVMVVVDSGNIGADAASSPPLAGSSRTWSANDLSTQKSRHLQLGGRRGFYHVSVATV